MGDKRKDCDRKSGCRKPGAKKKKKANKENYLKAFAA